MLRTSASVGLFGLALLLLLVTVATPREDGEISEPGFLVLCYVLPVVGMAAAAAVRTARRVWLPLVAAVASCGGWFLVVLELW